MELTCPKCQGAMRTYERNGVHVDQCTECRGIFLDRGELERLVDAEQAWHTPAGAPAPDRAPDRATAGSGAGASAQGSLGALVGEVLQQAKSAKTGSSAHRPKSKASMIGQLFG